VINLECNDPKCPIHGNLKTRGAEFEGIVVSTKAAKTAIIKREYTIFLHKYERSLRKTSKIHAYSPECMNIKTGDKVLIAGCRKVSKTKAFVVMKKVSGD